MGAAPKPRRPSAWSLVPVERYAEAASPLATFVCVVTVAMVVAPLVIGAALMAGFGL